MTDHSPEPYFQPGDVVLCKSTESTDLKIDHYYTVQKVSFISEQEYVWLWRNLYTDNPVLVEYFASRFVLHHRSSKAAGQRGPCEKSQTAPIASGVHPSPTPAPSWHQIDWFEIRRLLVWGKFQARHVNSPYFNEETFNKAIEMIKPMLALASSNKESCHAETKQAQTEARAEQTGQAEAVLVKEAEKLTPPPSFSVSPPHDSYGRASPALFAHLDPDSQS